MIKRAILGIIVVSALVAGACVAGNGGETRAYTAEFSRAVQVFPGVKVRILGVDVGQVTEVTTGRDSVEVAFRIDDPAVVVPADVRATIVPISLLGERYIQLFPAYEGGGVLASGGSIPASRTSVPAEGDELMQAMQDYFGELDGQTVEEFVSNAANVLEGKGARLNRLIQHGTQVISTLSSRRDELANMIVQFDKVARALSTRGDALARVINSYNTVAATLNDVRGSLEGTITGLNDASAALAGLLIDHRGALGADIETLTRTTRTLQKNIDSFARTGKWARRLFSAASRAVDYERDWLRLSNQGGPLGPMIMNRVEDRLVGLCLRLDQKNCQKGSYWEQRFPELFCLSDQDCSKPEKKSRDRTAGQAIEDLPKEVQDVIDKAANRNCKKAKHPKKCRKAKKEAQEAQEDGDLTDALEDVIDDVIDDIPVDDVGDSLPGGGLP
jgi:phospholipid/cholesterol/gamma-HCH transport system substrate-binding protein